MFGDGAAWIWRLAAEELPGAIQIVDLWHTKEHLWEVGRALGLEEAARKAGACAGCDELDQGRLAAVLQGLDGAGAACAEATQCAEYIRRNRARMQYAAFRAQGLCVGSGVVEAAARRSGPGSNTRAGTGRRPEPTPSWPCAPTCSATATRTLGNAGPALHRARRAALAD